MSSSDGVAYGDMVVLQAECAKRFGGPMDLSEIVSRPEYVRALDVGGLVLDIGAGRKQPLRAELGISAGDERYETLDSDPRGSFTYATWSEVPDKPLYDLIVAGQFLEHLAPLQAQEFFRNAAARLTVDGVLVCTVPNMFHPTRYWRDSTHCSTWTYMDVYAACTTAGLAVADIVRYGKQSPKGLINRFLARRVGMLFAMDWCDSIMVVAGRMDSTSKRGAG